jgi:hypothetical protein
MLSHGAGLCVPGSALCSRGCALLRALPLCSDSDRDARSINDTGLQFKFLVPASVVGAVLGRGGSTVAAIKRETGAYVQFTRPGTATNTPKERMMIVAVEGVQQLADAVAMVLEAVQAEGALDKLRTKQFAADKIFFQQVRRLQGPRRTDALAGPVCLASTLAGGGAQLGVAALVTVGAACAPVLQGRHPNAEKRPPKHTLTRLSPPHRRSSPPCARAR